MRLDHADENQTAQGHVDTTATLLSIVPTGNALTLTLRLNHDAAHLPLPSTLSPYLIPKGYVTLDGASLTLIDVSPSHGGALPAASRKVGADEHAADLAAAQERGEKETVEFTVMLIAHTQEIIGLPSKKKGDTVNVELDMVGKFVYRAVLGATGAADALPTQQEDEDKSTKGRAQVDAGRAVVGAGPSEDALERMVERIVRKVLAEERR